MFYRVIFLAAWRRRTETASGWRSQAEATTGFGGSSAADQGNLFRFGTVGAFLHASADSTIVQGSLFGLAADGTMPAGNAVGLFLYGAMNTTASENTFSANNTGMLLAGGATSTKIQDNHFGFGADWLTVLPNSFGAILMQNASGTLASGNTIAGSVSVESGERNSVLNNDFIIPPYEGLPVDIRSPANGDLSAPVITSAIANGTQVMLSGAAGAGWPDGDYAFKAFSYVSSTPTQNGALTPFAEFTVPVSSGMGNFNVNFPRRSCLQILHSARLTCWEIACF